MAIKKDNIDFSFVSTRECEYGVRTRGREASVSAFPASAPYITCLAAPIRTDRGWTGGIRLDLRVAAAHQGACILHAPVRTAGVWILFFQKIAQPRPLQCAYILVVLFVKFTGFFFVACPSTDCPHARGASASAATLFVCLSAVSFIFSSRGSDLCLAFSGRSGRISYRN